MRYGKLLTQDKPEDLIQKYNAVVSYSCILTQINIRDDTI